MGAALLAAAAAYAWWAAVRPPFSVSAHVAVFTGAAGLALVSASLPGARHREGASLDPQWVATWSAIVAAVVAFELFNYFQAPRSDHPTLSSMLDSIASPWARRAMFVGWLALGWRLVRIRPARAGGGA